uniref:DUF1524 domain-containing protein n=1 Tax=Strongyloides venezuelensis TaxID=75913 RepID=A0A0K0FJR8_STRVS
MCYCKTIEEKGFKLSTSKWKVLTMSTMFLGVQLCEGKFKPNEKKIASLKAMSVPRDKDQLISFLGLLKYDNHWTLKEEKMESLKNLVI